MIAFLARIFIKNSRQIDDSEVRRRYGVLCCIVGIFLNIILFLIKYLAGAFSGSIALVADAFNNLSDAGSSIVTMVGFHLGGKKPDPSHPYGHGRIEYVSGLIVSMIILLMGVELARTSIEKIIHPAAVEVTPIVIAVLLISIAVKVYIYSYNMRLGKQLKSAAMRATGLDSLSDCAATAAVLISFIITAVCDVHIDGWIGVLVSLFILYAGASTAKDTLDLLLGKKPETDVIGQIEDIVLAYDEIIGMHDLIVHDYGPGCMMVSLHAEVPGTRDIYELHDIIDRVEVELSQKLNCEAVIHMDPIAVHDESVANMRASIIELVHAELGEEVSIHDFRMVIGPTHTNLIFDIVLPYHLKIDEKTAADRIKNAVSSRWKNHHCILKIDRPYV